jgi:ABC-type Fe3+ transport system permease subunit
MGPAVVSVWLVAFVSAVRELPVSVLLYGVGTQTLPVLTWNRLLDGSYGAASAIAVVQIVLVAIVYFVADRGLRLLFVRGRKSQTARTQAGAGALVTADSSDATGS